MRYVSLTPLLLLLLTCCMPYKELPVEYDYSYDGDFTKYKTFDLFVPATDKDYLEQNPVIEDLIVDRMKFLGYKRSARRPNLLVSYKVYFDSLNFNGYNQPDLEFWMKTKNKDLEYSPLKFNLARGTLLIQLYDNRKNRSIWQGYATANYGDIVYNDQRALRNAVLSILDKYRVFAEGFEDRLSSDEFKSLTP